MDEREEGKRLAEAFASQVHVGEKLTDRPIAVPFYRACMCGGMLYSHWREFKRPGAVRCDKCGKGYKRE